jgi:hypothetical protein
MFSYVIDSNQFLLSSVFALCFCSLADDDGSDLISLKRIDARRRRRRSQRDVSFKRHGDTRRQTDRQTERERENVTASALLSG